MKASFLFWCEHIALQLLYLWSPWSLMFRTCLSIFCIIWDDENKTSSCLLLFLPFHSERIMIWKVYLVKKRQSFLIDLSVISLRIISQLVEKFLVRSLLASPDQIPYEYRQVKHKWLRDSRGSRLVPAGEIWGPTQNNFFMGFIDKI